MDKVWRFFRTVAWASVGVVAVTSFLIPLLKALELGEYGTAKSVAVVGGLTVIGAGILAVAQALIQKEPTTVLQRTVNQFGQTIVAGLAAPFLADTLFNTVAGYGQALLGLFISAIVAALMSFVVNQRESDPEVATPVATPSGTPDA